MTDNWDQPGVPHKGWHCVTVYDLGEDGDYEPAKCQMCERTQVRYVHVMEHDDYPAQLEVGCDCAEKLSGDYVNPKTRESSLRKRADHPQSIINRQLLPGCDFLMAIIRHKLGTQTPGYGSGTVEETNQFAKLHCGNRVISFVSNELIPPQYRSEQQRLLDFRKTLSQDCLYVSFESPEAFAHAFDSQLTGVIDRIIESFPPESVAKPDGGSIIRGDGRELLRGSFKMR